MARAGTRGGGHAGDEAGFCVVYRFRVRPGAEDAFRAAWRRLTLAIRAQRGGLGSRLHRADDGTWLAYAQWPDRAAWERSRVGESPDAAASAAMREAIAEQLAPVPLEPTDDLLAAVPARPADREPPERGAP